MWCWVCWLILFHPAEERQTHTSNPEAAVAKSSLNPLTVYALGFHVLTQDCRTCHHVLTNTAEGCLGWLVMWKSQKWACPHAHHAGVGHVTRRNTPGVCTWARSSPRSITSLTCPLKRCPHVRGQGRAWQGRAGHGVAGQGDLFIFFLLFTAYYVKKRNLMCHLMSENLILFYCIFKMNLYTTAVLVF